MFNQLIIHLYPMPHDREHAVPPPAELDGNALIYAAGYVVRSVRDKLSC